MTTSQNNTKGILFILIGMVVFSIQDALIKFVYEDAALYELYLGRTLSAAFFLFCYMKFIKQKINFKTHYPLLTTLRIICFFFGFSFFYISLTYMSLAMANALFFSSHFFVSILAIIFLNEKVGIRRWLAISLGFIGVFIVLNPDFNDFDYKKLAPIACALCYSISMTITKYTSDKDNSYTQMMHLYFGATIISILFFIFTGSGQFDNSSDPTFQFIFREWFTNPTYAWPIIILMGFIGALAFFCVFNAYSIASPSVVSLYEYSLIIWSIIIGYILFDNIPTIRTFVGVSIIIGAGIYIYLREKVKDQMIVTDTPNR
jgi:drug/metabolite transporter (DMT)-like permease